MKLEIIGSVASGKTTLAKQLSEQYGIPHIEKDNVVWERLETGDRKRQPEERDALFQELLAQDFWIVEGSPRKSLHESFEEADWIVLLEPLLIVRLWRMLGRWIRQRQGKEIYHGQPSVSYLLTQIRWIWTYQKQMMVLESVLLPYRDKLRSFQTAQEVIDFMEEQYWQM